MDVWNKSTLRSLVLPGGILLLFAAVLAHSGWIALPSASLHFLSDCALLGGLLLAWRFHSSRIFLALLVLYVAEQAIVLLAPAHAGSAFPPGLAALGVVIPLNVIIIAFVEERGFTVSNVAPALLFLFMQAVFVAVLAHGTETTAARARHPAHVTVPSYVVLAFVAAGLLLLTRFLRTHKPADNALFWSLIASFLSFYFRSAQPISAVYSLSGLTILAISIVETSYLFAYHDELTSLPSRRAFNDALHRLEAPYSIAAVDIDHFKHFNDTYGHDIGDQVLRLVASKLARVTGGGHAYRCGGEEFTLLFPGKAATEVAPHLEQLRVAIENAHFHMRGSERRQVPRGPDRRSGRSRNHARKADAIRQLARPVSRELLSVTVSMGVAAGLSQTANAEQVLQAADNALYRAKANGRNRVEVAASRRPGRSKAAGIA